MTFFIIFICLIVKEGAELENRKMVLLLGAGAAPGGHRGESLNVRFSRIRAI